MDDSVSLQLSSRDSQLYYPGNRASDFKVNIKPALDLEGQWKVGIREISYPSQVIPQQCKVTFEFLDEEGKVWGQVSNETALEELSTPDNFVSFVMDTFANIRRRPNTLIAHYTIYDMLELSIDPDPRVWSRTHRRKYPTQQCLDDIPGIEVVKIINRKRKGIRVTLFDENGKKYFRKHYPLPRFISKKHLANNPEITNPHIYNYIGPLPRRPRTTDWRTGQHNSPTFALRSVADFSFDSSRHQFRLNCISNREGVCGMVMTVTCDGIDNSFKVLQGESVYFANPWKIMDVIAVHSNIVEECQFGDTRVNLLALVPRMQPNSKDAYSHIRYKKIRYLPVSHSLSSLVTVQFKTLHGKPIQFSSGTGDTFITLEFKKAS